MMKTKLLRRFFYLMMLLIEYSCVKDPHINKPVADDATYSVSNLKMDYEMITRDLNHYNDFYTKVNWDDYDVNKRNDTTVYIFKLYEGEIVGSGSTFSANIKSNVYNSGFLTLYPSRKSDQLMSLHKSVTDRRGSIPSGGVCGDCHWNGGTIPIQPVPVRPPVSPPSPPVIIPVMPGPSPSVPPNMLNPRNDCEHARNMEFDNNLILQLRALRTHADDPNKRTEKGFTYEINYTTGLYTRTSLSFEGHPNAPQANFNLSSPIDGMAHTHYKGLFPIFSPADITAMAAIYNSGYMRNPAVFSSILLTNAGTTYMLKIENVAQFRNWASNYRNNFEVMSQLFEQSVRHHSLGTQHSVSTNEKSINQILKQFGTGIRLYRGDRTLGNWKRLKLDNNNNVVLDPC